MLELCLFDLDQTLVDTDDLKEIREEGRHNSSVNYLKSLEEAFNTRDDRHLYEEKFLEEIRAQYPNLKLAVFTRSPRRYATAILAMAYPDFKWDLVVAYEDVRRTKPSGQGIEYAMETLGITDVENVIMVGDGDPDVRAAYNAGCLVVLDNGAWPAKREWEHWNAIGHVADAIISKPQELLAILKFHWEYLPALESLLTVEAPSEPLRFDCLNHFIPRELGGSTSPIKIWVCGRFFANYVSVQKRRSWHRLTEQILDVKEAEEFPSEWIEAVRAFIDSEYIALRFMGRLIVSVIPARPRRSPRLEKFLAQLERSYAETPHRRKDAISFAPNLLAYKEGVRSNSNDHLSKDERFKNIQEYLYVNKPDLIKAGVQVLLIDDVVTTGSTLCFAHKYLKELDAGEVKCLAFAKNIGNVA